jgi:hypothetical protein
LQRNRFKIHGNKFAAMPEPFGGGWRCRPTPKPTKDITMPGPEIQPSEAPAFPPAGERARYLVLRRQDVWFIEFGGEEFGPYQTEREARLFAIDAAYKLGEQGEQTEVLVADESGEASVAWSYGKDPYPPIG